MACSREEGQGEQVNQTTQTKLVRLTIGLMSSLGLGWLIYRAGQSEDGPLSSLIPSEVAPELATSVNMTAARLAAHKGARPIIEQAFKDVMGRAPTAFEAQYAQAVGFAESSYGKGWQDAMKACFNWGAVQCPANNQTGPGCVPYQDSHSSGEKYAVSFRCYANDLEGAKDLIKHVFKNRPVTASILASKDGTTFRTSYAMRREAYYGGFCPKATTQYGEAAAKASFGHPDRDAGTRACMAEAVGLHAQRVQGLMREIAWANGDKLVFPLGTFNDADEWYLKNNPNPLRGK